VYGAPAVQFEPVDVRESVSAAATQLHDSLSAKHLTLRLDMPPDPVMSPADRDRLRQAIAHVLSNAVKFSHQAGTIDIRVAQEDGRVTITVVDRGEGIDANILPFIFDRFRQGNASTTRPHGGLGIGLALVQHIVKLHGGSVVAQSAGATTGASFVIT